MQNVQYDLFKRKIEEFIQETTQATGSMAPTPSFQTDMAIAPLRIAFIGQYSAGKSSLIKMLTGFEHIKVGAGVTTFRVDEYSFGSVQIWDTPGILAGVCEEHDADALEAIKNADLLVFVITNELFDDVVGQAFRRLCFQQGRAKDLMIVVNKSGNDSGSRDTKISGMSAVLEPRIPEDFKIVFTDAQSYFDALDEDDEFERRELEALANRSGFVKAIDEFVAERGIAARLTQPLSELQDRLESMIASLDVSDPKTAGLISILEQFRKAFRNRRRHVKERVEGLLEEMVTKMEAQGNELADCVGTEISQHEFEATQQRANDQCGKSCSAALKSIEGVLVTCQEDLEQELVAISESPLARKVKAAFETIEISSLRHDFTTESQFSVDGPAAINTAFNQTLLSGAKRGCSWITENAVGNASKSGLTKVSGSPVHSAVKELGNFFGHSFKPYEAIKIADGIGKGAKFLGPAMACIGVLMQFYDDYQQSQRAKQILEAKREIRKAYKAHADFVRAALNKEMKAMLTTAFDTPLGELDGVLNQIREETVSKSDQSLLLKKRLGALMALRDEIQAAC
ncbi:GTPase domain-containing protein [Azohydromonas aeria]|uniref:GTPase domain-containing protein n=1 Tax=Azohydromonas aeria TaxID=2590212 RepID=UPI0012F714F9|nr:GTPase domain-containing protein [Azohydromonas aeria]